MTDNPLNHINPHDPRLLPEESAALIRILEKRENYVRRGLAREAHGVGAAALICWRCLTGDIPFSIDSKQGDF